MSPGLDVAGQCELKTEVRCPKSILLHSLEFGNRSLCCLLLKGIDYFGQMIRYGFSYALTTTFQATLRVLVAAPNIVTEVYLAFVQIKLCLHVLKGN